MFELYQCTSIVIESISNAFGHGFVICKNQQMNCFQ